MDGIVRENILSFSISIMALGNLNICLNLNYLKYFVKKVDKDSLLVPVMLFVN